MAEINKDIPKDIKLYFTHEKKQGIILRDFRQHLEKQLSQMFLEKPIKQIPEEFEVKLKYNIIYTIYFLNKEYLVSEFKHMIFDPKLVRWIVDNDLY